MEYTEKQIEKIKQLYINPPYPTINSIATKLKIPPKTIYRWRDERNWDRVLQEVAKTMYIEEQISTKDIARSMHRSHKKIEFWRINSKWDQDKYIIGDIALSREAMKKFKQEVQKSLKENTFADPGTADKLVKLLKIIEKLSPQRVRLANIFEMLKDLADWTCTLGDPEFSKLFQNHLPEIADYLRKKYAAE